MTFVIRGEFQAPDVLAEGLAAVGVVLLCVEVGLVGRDGIFLLPAEDEDWWILREILHRNSKKEQALMSEPVPN